NSQVKKQGEGDLPVFSDAEEIGKAKFSVDFRFDRPRYNQLDEIVHGKLPNVRDGFEDIRGMNGSRFLRLSNDSSTIEFADVMKDKMRAVEERGLRVGLVVVRAGKVISIIKFLHSMGNPICLLFVLAKVVLDNGFDLVPRKTTYAMQLGTTR